MKSNVIGRSIGILRYRWYWLSFSIGIGKCEYRQSFIMNTRLNEHYRHKYDAKLKIHSLQEPVQSLTQPVYVVMLDI